ncbi:MAG: DNA starvation/stationary phase protection protein, partial [Acidimicrobiia bacterium]
AERAVALGTPVDARPSTVAAEAGRSFPMGWLSDHEVAVELVDRITPVAETIHASLAALESSDPVAHDAAVETLEGLEKYRWMLLAHTR